MSILIKGMKKPTACYKCQLRTGKYCGILTENEKCADDGVLPHCPLVEIPPHGRLIDADKLDRHFIYASDDNIAGMGYVDSEQEIYNEAIDDARLTVQDAPTVIESEEQEHE